MGAFNVPDAGISLNGQIYISAKTGHTMAAGDAPPVGVPAGFGLLLQGHYPYPNHEKAIANGPQDLPRDGLE